LIKITGQRIIYHGEVFINPERLEEPYQALTSLVVFELGYGGRITEVAAVDGQISIAVLTKILQCVDTTVFSGSEAEMNVLLEFLSYYVAILKNRDSPRLKESVFKALVGTNNLLLANFGCILHAETEIFIALAAWAGLDSMSKINLAIDLVYHYHHGVNGLRAFIEVIQYMKELDYSFEEACEGLYHVTGEGAV